ncbi:hypothetical protein VTO42DRAFT_929 [Malbranchea cinnamomea]
MNSRNDPTANGKVPNEENQERLDNVLTSSTYFWSTKILLSLQKNESQIQFRTTVDDWRNGAWSTVAAVGSAKFQASRVDRGVIHQPTGCRGEELGVSPDFVLPCTLLCLRKWSGRIQASGEDGLMDQRVLRRKQKGKNNAIQLAWYDRAGGVAAAEATGPPFCFGWTNILGGTAFKVNS